MVHAVNNAVFFLAIKNCQTLAKIIHVSNLPILKTDISGRDHGSGQRRKLGVRRRNPPHLYSYLSIPWRNTKVREVSSHFFPQVSSRTRYVNVRSAATLRVL